MLENRKYLCLFGRTGEVNEKILFPCKYQETNLRDSLTGVAKRKKKKNTGVNPRGKVHKDGKYG